MTSLAANLFTPTKDDFGIDRPSKTSKSSSTKPGDKAGQFRAILENSRSQERPLSNDSRGEREPIESDLAHDGTLHANEIIPETSTKHSEIDTSLGFTAKFNEQNNANLNASDSINIDLDLESNDVSNGHDLSSRVVNGPIHDTGEHPTFVAVDTDDGKQVSSSTNLSPASLPPTNLPSANLSSANLSSTNSPPTNLSSTNLSSTNLSPTNLSSASLLPTNLAMENDVPKDNSSSQENVSHFASPPSQATAQVLSPPPPASSVPSMHDHSDLWSTTAIAKPNNPSKAHSVQTPKDPEQGWSIGDLAEQFPLAQTKQPKAKTVLKSPATDLSQDKSSQVRSLRAKSLGAAFSRNPSMKQDAIDEANRSHTTDTTTASKSSHSSTSSPFESNPSPSIQQNNPSTTLNASLPSSEHLPNLNTLPSTQGLSRAAPPTPAAPATAEASPDATSIDVFDHMPFSAVREVIDQAFHSLRPLAAGGAELSMNVPELGQLKLKFEATDSGFTIDLQTSDANLAEQINRESISFAKLFRLDGKTVEMQASTFAEREEGTNSNYREESEDQHSNREFEDSQHADQNSKSFSAFHSRRDSEEATELNLQQRRPPSTYGLSLVDEMA